jgi:protein-S-isoprenylcysteine O-methyltransferase Ste14
MAKNITATLITIIGIIFLIAKQISASEFHKYYAFIIPYAISNSVVLITLIMSVRTRVKDVNSENLTFIICVAAANLPIFVSIFGASLANPEPVQIFRKCAVFLSLAAIPLYIAAVISLGSRISVLPVASALETGGLYSFSRHPLYCIYIYWYIMQVFMLQSWSIVLISAIQISFQIYRAKAEEKILEKNFPEYSLYRQQVWWVGRPAYRTKFPGRI